MTLRFSERGLYDCRPVSLLGNATARALADELAVPLDRRRFRANLHVDWNEERSGREDDLVGRTLQLGGQVRIAVLERDPRCLMITLDPDTAASDPRLLRHVVRSREGKVGVYAAVLVEGVVRPGDPVLLV